jgi:hypothetical protein
MSLMSEKKDLNFDLLYEYLNEKYKEDLSLLELTKATMSREEYYIQKTRLTEIEHQLLLIRNKNG